MWRDPQNSKTALHYSIPERDVLRNRLRAASAWMGPWVKKVQSFMEFSDVDVGSLANFDEIKDRLKCGTFQGYLRRFEDLFFGTGMLPSSVFHLKAAGRCLTLDLYTRQPYMHDCIEGFEGQVWHGSNSFSQEDLQCCSGLKLWNYNYCLSWYGGSVLAGDCAFFGTSRYQQFHVSLESEVVITAPDIKDVPHCLQPGELSKPVALVKSNVSRLELVSPRLFRLVLGKLCLVSLPELVLVWSSCDMAAGLEVIGQSEGRKQLRVADQCLDAAQGTGVVLYPCHSPENRVPNQVFIAEEGGPLCWPFGDGSAQHLQCLGEVNDQPEVVLQPCANKLDRPSLDEGQIFKRQAGGGSFLLRQGSGCLGPDWKHPIDLDGEEAFLLSLQECSQRWTQRGHSLALSGERDIALCLSAADFKRPVVTNCWPEDMSQHFDLKHLPSGLVVQKRAHWADSGRERYPALCVDTTASPKLPLSIEPCEGSVPWAFAWEEVPLETQLAKDI